MKLNKVLLRWYKSFHLNYRGLSEKGETTAYRPWNKLAPSYATSDDFPFIEIPIEGDITTIVGANESGKSHLLNAISKVVRGSGINPEDTFERTDLCHYAGVRTRNIEAWPNIGLQFIIETDEDRKALSGIAETSFSGVHDRPASFAVILAPEEGKNRAYLFVAPNPQAIPLTEEQLAGLRQCLPAVQFIDSRAQLASEIPLAQLISAYGDSRFAGIALPDRRAVEEAASLLRSLPSGSPGQPVPPDWVQRIDEIKRKLENVSTKPIDGNSLELQLFQEILGIKLETLHALYRLTTADRGYIEGQISKWNDEILDRLNLAHFWRQDEQFSLTVNYKDGVVYFEIHDKTDSIYTFKERSSGLKFFLSYYIQAKALEMSGRNKNSIILMDEPDSALSILGQRNLLAVFESLVSPESSNQTCQLIYTTHSPYLINRNYPRRIRVVKKEDAEEGTQYIEQVRARRYEPVRTALGIDSAPSLFLGSDNVLLEGATDQYLLTELIRVFATPGNVNDFLDLNSIVVVSADGVGNVENVLEQSRWADEPIPPTAIVLDGDAPARKVIEKLVAQSGARRAAIDPSFITTISDLVKPFGDSAVVVTSEDIIPKTMYARAVKQYIKKWLSTTFEQRVTDIDQHLASPDFGKDGLVASTKELFRIVKPEFGGDYDKMGILQEVVALALEELPKLESNSELAQLRGNLILICDFIRETLSKSRAAAAKVSMTQAVKRIIHDFNRQNKDNVPVTALQKLFKRMEHEVAPIGPDGDAFLRVVTNSLADLLKLRTAGQDRISGEQWSVWHAHIENIRKNPLGASDVKPAAETATATN